MMQQYADAKAACEEALLLFRMGDFYELFHDDAQEAARLLGLTLTSRDKGDNPIPMAGFPHHQLDGYLAKLVRLGRRVAICEQVEDPKKATGLVKREITRVVTPGTLTDDGLLDPRESNFLLAMVCASGRRSITPADRGPTTEAVAIAGDTEVGLAWIDLSTGRFFASVVLYQQLSDELARIAPVELVVPDSLVLPRTAQAATISRRPDWTFSAKLAQERLQQQFGAYALEGFGFTETETLATRAAGAVLEYLRDTQRTTLSHIERLDPYRTGSGMEIDASSRRSLEITRTLHDGSRSGSLLAVLDCTVTAMGSRMLGQWLVTPLVSPGEINARLDAVDELRRQAGVADGVRSTLRDTYDLQRLLARVSTGRANPRDLAFVGKTLARLPLVKRALEPCAAEMLQTLRENLDLCPEIAAELETALTDECPLTAQEGGIFLAGYDASLDGLRELAAGGKRWIAEYQAAQARDAGIPNLKVGYNKVFGYYIEVSNAHRDQVPSHFIRRQTLKNAERFVTEELKSYEDKVVVADQQAKDREYELFVSLRENVRAAGSRLQKAADVLAQLDVLAGFAELARRRNYCRPEPVDEPVIDIREGRHPVLDALEPDGTFVPNDTQTGPDDGWILLITGPNMAGKSTYIRQVAHLTLMMQVGSFVPAQSARIGVVDRIFARVGAGDRLTHGQSTFMVEMTEAARILNGASRKSLVILDEIGRGTSTYDGVSLAWAIVEYLHDRIGCRTLFATHYHELTDLDRTLPGVVNLNVLVREADDTITFIHKIAPGAADKSYGIHVARLAGVPREVQHRAQVILQQLELAHAQHDRGDATDRADPAQSTPRPKWKSSPQVRRNRDLQLTLFTPYDHPLIDEIRSVDASNLSELEAWQLVQQWRAQLDDERLELRQR